MTGMEWMGACNGLIALVNLLFNDFTASPNNDGDRQWSFDWFHRGRVEVVIMSAVLWCYGNDHARMWMLFVFAMDER
jgi:hypothetical protein